MKVCVRVCCSLILDERTHEASFDGHYIGGIWGNEVLVLKGTIVGRLE